MRLTSLQELILANINQQSAMTYPSIRRLVNSVYTHTPVPDEILKAELYLMVKHGLLFQQGFIFFPAEALECLV